MQDSNDTYNEVIRAFFDQWHVYDVLVKNDYMAHAGILRVLRESLSAREESFSVIDLGCGDASRMADTLDGLPLSAYVGVDLSSVALEMARSNADRIAANASFFEMDFLSFLDSARCEPADVIVIGFAAHHLNEEDKRRLLRLCSRKLREEGALYYYDVFRREGQSRDQYFEAFFSNVDDNWLALSPEGREELRNHVLNCDRPEMYSTIAGMASEAGFAVPGKPLFQDDTGFHRLYRFGSESAVSQISERRNH